VKRYWRRSDKPGSSEVNATSSIVEKNFGKVICDYKISNGKITPAAKYSKWTVEFNFFKKEKWWVIKNIQIEGVEL
jgi:hypothetical protein